MVGGYIATPFVSASDNHNQLNINNIVVRTYIKLKCWIKELTLYIGTSLSSEIYMVYTYRLYDGKN